MIDKNQVQLYILTLKLFCVFVTTFIFTHKATWRVTINKCEINFYWRRGQICIRDEPIKRLDTKWLQGNINIKMAENSLLMFEVILFSEISGCPADPLLFISGGPSENQSAAGHRATAYVEPCRGHLSPITASSIFVLPLIGEIIIIFSKKTFKVLIVDKIHFTDSNFW